MQSVIPAMATSNIQDVKKGRQLLKSVRETNPAHAPAWIASARIEEAVGEMQKARNLITLGCEKCPRHEDVWLEAARLQEGDMAKKVCAAAIQRLPKSVKIWTRAAQLETENKAKRRVFRRALEHVPESVQLWKQAVNLEKPGDARIMLSRAVECCPTSQELWLALARLESYENARKVLNKARKHIPTERQIWIAAAQLEESNNETERMESMIDKIIARSIESLQTNGVEIYREHWLDEAKKCEKDSFPITCGAIVKNVIGVGIEAQDHENTWTSDIQACLSYEQAELSIHTARSIYAHALSLYPNNHTFWEDAAYFERKHGTADQLEDLLEEAVRVCPKNENFWLMAAKSKWKSKHDIGLARKILASAFKVNPNSEKIWLAAVKLEQENNEPIRARKLLAKARSQANTPRVWMTSVKLEWQLDNMVDALDLVKQSVKKYSKFFKLYLMHGQILEQLQDREQAHNVYLDGVKNCPTCSELWIYLSRNQQITHSISKARATLEKALVKNPVDTKIWKEFIELEIKTNGKDQAQQVLARAQQAIPKDGLLWSLAIIMTNRNQRKHVSVRALKECPNSQDTLLVVGRMFQQERKVQKAREWLHRALKADNRNGDAWAFLYAFELECGNKDKADEVETRMITAEPSQGQYWTAVSKNVRNWKLKPKELLQLVVKTLPKSLEEHTKSQKT